MLFRNQHLENKVLIILHIKLIEKERVEVKCRKILLKIKIHLKIE